MILALSNSKGGVGKTTIAVHLAIWLAEQGNKVVFVDSDVQGSSSTWIQEAAPAMQVLRLPTSDDVLTQMPSIRSQADYIIADGPAGLSEVTRSLFFCSDLAILPCGPSVLDLRAVIDAIRVIHEMRKVNSGLPREIIIPNKLQPQYRLSKDLVQTLKAGGVLAGDGLRLRQAYGDAAQHGTVVWRLNTPSARAATAEIQFLFQQLLSYVPNNNSSING